MTPPRVDDVYRYVDRPPPQASYRLAWWLGRIRQGFRPNRRIRGMGYSMAAKWYGVYVWEYIHVLCPATCADE